MSHSQKIFLIFSVILILTAANSAWARELEVTYPAAGNIPGPSSTRTLLPDYLKYIFNLIVALSGIVVFGIIVFSGFRYATSAGNPTQMADAWGRIGSAAIGMVIILSSYLILNTINPQLLVINPILSSNEGVIVYDSVASCNKGLASPDSQESLKPDVDYIKFGVSSRTLESLSGKAGAVWLYRPTEDLKINLYPAKDWGGTGVAVEGQSGTCLASPLISAQSIELAWQNPGVYLCKDTAGKECSVYSSSQPKLADGFDNKVKSIRFKNTENVKYGAVLHENPNYGSTCQDFTANSPVNFNASSITVFLKGTPEGKGVTLFDDIEYNGASTTSFTSDQKTFGDFNNIARSVQIDGNYLVLLFHNIDYKGTCEVFNDDDPNLLIGNPITSIRKNTASSLKVIPVKR